MTRHRVGLLPYWLVAPTLLIVVAFIIYPVIETFRLSFTDTNLLLAARIPPKFVGFATYGKALSDPLLPTVLKNTVIWVFVGTLLTLLIGVAIGYYLSFDWKINRLLRAGLLIPWIIPSVVIAAAWKWMYNDQLGVINDILKRLGVIHEGIPFLGLPQWVIFPLTFVVAWRAAPLTAMVVSAAIQGVPTSLLEAATIDGANGWQKFRYIVLPFLAFLLTVITLLTMIGITNDLVFVYSMTLGGPAHASEIMATYIYQVGFDFWRFGQAAALSVLNFGFLLILSIAYLYLFRRTWQRKDA
jgi:multiple sugar transport system permease protein